MAATFVVTPAASSQNPPSTIPLGTISDVDPLSSCPSGFYTGMTCEQLTVSCPSTDNITVTVGYVGPTQRTTPFGTIVFFGGGSGTKPAEDNDSMLTFAGDYVTDYTIVNLAWASAWAEASPSKTYAQNILLAACRPATLLSWINGNSTFHSASAMCSQGKSAGSAAIAYSMSWYGAGKTSSGGYLTNVELLAGPVLTEIDQGCKASPPQVEMCDGQSWCLSSYGAATDGWTTSAMYTSDKVGDINNWAGISDCGSSSGSELTTLQHMSIVGGQYTGVTPTYSFTTKRHGWVCAGSNRNYDNYVNDCPDGNTLCPNNSSPQGWYWYNQASDSNMVLTGTNKCDGTTTSGTSTEAEGVDGTNALDPVSGTSEQAKIESDMRNNCQ